MNANRGAATQIAARKFDQKFFSLPADLQRRMQRKLDEVGERLATYPHYKMEGVDTFRLRIGDYRVIYEVDIGRNQIYLITVGHRREIYKA